MGRTNLPSTQQAFSPSVLPSCPKSCNIIVNLLVWCQPIEGKENWGIGNQSHIDTWCFKIPFNDSKIPQSAPKWSQKSMLILPEHSQPCPTPIAPWQGLAYLLSWCTDLYNQKYKDGAKQGRKEGHNRTTVKAHTPRWETNKWENNYNCKDSPQGVRGLSPISDSLAWGSCAKMRSQNIWLWRPAGSILGSLRLPKGNRYFT